MLGYENKIETIKDSIQELITYHKTVNKDIFEQCNELSKIESTKLSKQDKIALKEQILLSEQEMELRALFVSQLEDIL